MSAVAPRQPICNAENPDGGFFCGKSTEPHQMHLAPRMVPCEGPIGRPVPPGGWTKAAYLSWPNKDYKAP